MNTGEHMQHVGVADGSMPCDGAWSSEHVQRFRAWMDAGCPR